jgi:hypothetical protein
MRHVDSVTPSPIVGSSASNSRRQAEASPGPGRSLRALAKSAGQLMWIHLKPAGSEPNRICTISSARARAHGLSQAAVGIMMFEGQDAADCGAGSLTKSTFGRILTSPRKSYSFLRNSGSCQWQCPTGSSSVRMKKELTTRGPPVPTAPIGLDGTAGQANYSTKLVACDRSSCCARDLNSEYYMPTEFYVLASANE